ncbi:MAG: type II toxin-antitoxin system VapC family toxin [Melioribacteraceae bacterium]|jgi:predicted nucleic acid-binding protein|nr:type II toxin-antitoxin system VapC family toxin [Melioribacteraceae bacterium]
MIVVDTNVIAYFWMPGDYTQFSKSLFLKDADWVAPFLWRSEFRNIIALYLRKGLLSNSVAFEIVNNAEAMMKGKEYSINSFDVVHKINDCSLSSYDIEFVALAESLNVKLITLDKKIIREFPKIAFSLHDF